MGAKSIELFASLKKKYEAELENSLRIAKEKGIGEKELEKIANLIFKKYQMKNEAKLLENRKQAILIKEKREIERSARKIEDKKKILIGAMIMSDADLFNSALEQLDLFLTRNVDRALFGLDPKTA